MPRESKPVVSCKKCGIDFTPVGRRRVYCSPACTRRRGGGFGRQRICEVCAADYEASHPEQRTCSRACGRFIQYGWPTAVIASEVGWRNCPICLRPYTARGRRRCGCGLACTVCAKQIR